MRIVISSGHGKYIRGASGYPVPPQLDEVDEARRVVERVAKFLRGADVWVDTFHDDTSTSQNENLNTIVNYHNSATRDLDVSVHFNAYDGSAQGTEVLYVTQEGLSEEVCAAICGAGGFTNRGAKYRGDLFFLNSTEMPAILIEVCFCDNTGDSNKYNENFDSICEAIASALSGEAVGLPPRPDWPPIEAQQMVLKGRVSWFGGPEDSGVSPEEGLAFIYNYEDAPDLFLLEQPPGTSGLARRLNPETSFLAVRWDYDRYPKEMLASCSYVALVRAVKNGRFAIAFPADWGPHDSTGRVADISKSLMRTLDLETDDEVVIIYPVVR